MTKGAKSFSRTLSLYVVIVTSVLFVVSIAIAAISAHYLISDEATKSSRNMLQAQINSIETTLASVESTIKATAWLVRDNIDNDEYLWEITRKIVAENHDIVGSAIAFKAYYKENTYQFCPYSYMEDGQIYSKTLGSVGYDYFYLDWYQIPYLLKEPIWSEPYFDEGGARMLMSTYSYPILDADGEVIAILTADILTTWLSELVSQIKPYENSFMTIASRSGSYIATPLYESLKGETIFSTAMRARDPKALDLCKAMVRGESGVIKYKSLENKLSFAVYAPLSNGWSASLVCSYKDVLERTTDMNTILILIGLVGIMILFFICYFTISRLTKPLSEFSASAFSIANGNFNTALPAISSHDEIQTLRDAFDYLQSSLSLYIEDLKKTTAANEHYASELNIASAIQQSMLSSDFPKSDYFDMHALVNPAKEVGGDLYDFFVSGDNLYFTVGDVSGKGVPASLIMAITRSAFRFIASMNVSMSDVLSKINDAISDGNEMGMFVTMFVARINLKTGVMEYCNGGHNPIVVNDKFLDVLPNLAVGLMPDFPYQSQTVQLEKGSTLLLYTDGVTEAETSAKDQFGEDRLLSWCCSTDNNISASDACQSLLNAVHTFTAGNEQNDDITIMTIKLK